VVPNAKELIDIILSKTQRKTPTVVHPNYQISRIRTFYMQKVKFCQQSYHEKLSDILKEFPRLDDIHPFYADLCNVLYDRDHYKLALGQVAAVRNIIDNIAKDYVRLLKYADSAYKCKMLKRAGLGRMCTAVKKLQASLTYLEEVRQHLSRLPSINPSTRTLILSGYPNVGKSSFMNQVTNAGVQVEPYAFTTKSLFVGHFDYQYSRWQVIDTPGILDRPLDQRNRIEMSAITALAHIQASILYFIDVSEQCGWNIQAQVALFHSIKPLFKNKPVMVVCNKIDVKPIESLSEEDKMAIESMREGGDGVEFLATSCLKSEGVDQAKNRACDLLLKKRVEKKIETNKVGAIESRLHIAIPKNVRAGRQAFIPESVLQQRAVAPSGQLPEREWKTEKELQEEAGGAGVYNVDLNKRFLLENEEWRYDNVPEIFEGKNIADFIDPDINLKIRELEKEEATLLQEADNMDWDDVEWKETQRILDEIHGKIRLHRMEKGDKPKGHTARVARKKGATASEVEAHLGRFGYETEGVTARAARRRAPLSRAQPQGDAQMGTDESEPVLGKRKRGRDEDEDMTGGEAGAGPAGAAFGPVDVDMQDVWRNPKRARSDAISNKEQAAGLDPKKSQDKNPHKGRGVDRVNLGLAKEKDKKKALKGKLRTDKKLKQTRKKGEADRFIGNKMPKHLYSGKRGIGKTDWR